MPEQYFIYFHPHEHKHPHPHTYHEPVIEEVYHDCSDHLEYLSVQEFSEQIKGRFVLQEQGVCRLFHALLRIDEMIILTKGRSPPVIA